MKTDSEKEKKLYLAIDKLKELKHQNPLLKTDLENLNSQKNQLEIEKKEIEDKYESLVIDYKSLMKRLDKINRSRLIQLGF